MDYQSLINGESFTLVAGVIGAALLAFGVAFDQLTEFLERIGWSHGRSSILVITGVSVTLAAAVPLVGWRAAFIMLGLFSCSGLPMAAGQIIRHQRNLRRYMQRLQQDGSSGHLS